MTVLEEAPPWIQGALTLPPDVPEWARKIGVGKGYVSPATAADWIKRNTRNRKETPAVQARLARLMELYGFRVTTDAIGFFEDGTLANGQNRLKSVILAGIGQIFVIVWNLPWESAEGLDIGNRRSAAATAAILCDDDRPKPNMPLMATYRTLLILQRVIKGTMASWKDSRNAPTLGEQVALYKELDLRPEFKMAQGMWGRDETRLLPAPLAAAIYRVIRDAHGETYANTFFGELASGAHANGQLLAKDEPVTICRQQLNKVAKGIHRRSAEWLAAITIKTYVFWKWRLENRHAGPGVWTVDNLKWTPATEPFPSPVLPPSRAYRSRGTAKAEAELQGDLVK